MLRNAETTTLTVAQIVAHLRTKPWNVTYELQRGHQNQPGRLRGDKPAGSGVGRGGQWRVQRENYFAWLGLATDDLTHLGPDGLPELRTLPELAADLAMPEESLKTMIRQHRLPHLTFGRQLYLTHRQQQRLRDLLAESYRSQAR